MIQVQLSNVRSFLALPYEAALAPRLRHAHRHLRQHDGVGSDFTGWVELPVNYDRGSLPGLRRRRRRFRRILRRWWSSGSADHIWVPGA